MQPATRTRIVLSLSIALAVVTLFAPVRGFDYVDLDDNEYVFANAKVLAGLTRDSVHWALTAYHSGHWHPLTWLSLMFGVQVFGAEPGPAHGVNVVLHLAGVLVLFAALAAMTGSLWRSAVVAACFALHPLRVESVAWVAGRKDVLSGFFLMLTLWAYVRHVRRPSLARYASLILAYGMGLLAKPTLTVLPFGLLLLDVWPLRRWDGSPTKLGWRLLEKLPLFALAAATLTQTWQSQQAAGAVVGDGDVALADRLANATLSYVVYLQKTLWPVDLAVFYPLVPVPMAEAAQAGAILVLVTVLVFLGRVRWPYLLVGWLWYLGTFVPMIGIVQFGGQALADRYSYIPHIGLLTGLVWAMADACQRLRLPRWARALGAGLVLLALAAVSARQLAHWQNTFTLFEHALSVTEGNYMAHNNLGVACQQKGDLERASYHFAEAVRANPTWPDALLNYGNSLAWSGRYAQAKEQYLAALARRPTFAIAENNLATALAYEGDFAAAIVHYRRAVEVQPDYLDARFALADAYERTGDLAAAEGHYALVAAERPDWAPVQLALERVRAALAAGSR